MSMYQKYRDNINKLHSLLKPLGFTELVLNKAEPKSSNFLNNYEGSKGVDSDIIKIFKFPKGEKSFAFSFYYSNTETPYIMVTFKKGQGDSEKIVGTKLTSEQFREKLNSFLKLLNQSSLSNLLTEAEVEKKVMNHFLSSLYDAKEDSEEIVIQILSKVEELKNQNASLLKKRKDLLDEVSNAEKKVEATISASSKQMQLEKLRQEIQEGLAEVKKAKVLAEKNARLKDKQKELVRLTGLLDKIKGKSEEIVRLDDKKKELRLINQQLYNYESEVLRITKKESQKLPRVFHDSILERVKKTQAS
jgi:hypothetical protein